MSAWWSEVLAFCYSNAVFLQHCLFGFVVCQEPGLEGPLPPRCCEVSVPKCWLPGEKRKQKTANQSWKMREKEDTKAQLTSFSHKGITHVHGFLLHFYKKYLKSFSETDKPTTHPYWSCFDLGMHWFVRDNKQRTTFFCAKKVTSVVMSTSNVTAVSVRQPLSLQPLNKVSQRQFCRSFSVSGTKTCVYKHRVCSHLQRRKY